MSHFQPSSSALVWLENSVKRSKCATINWSLRGRRQRYGLQVDKGSNVMKSEWRTLVTAIFLSWRSRQLKLSVRLPDTSLYFSPGFQYFKDSISKKVPNTLDPLKCTSSWNSMLITTECVWVSKTLPSLQERALTSTAWLSTLSVRREGFEQLLMRWLMSGNVQPFVSPGTGYPRPSVIATSQAVLLNMHPLSNKCSFITQICQNDSFQVSIWDTTKRAASGWIASKNLRELQQSFQDQKLRRIKSTRTEKQ